MQYLVGFDYFRTSVVFRDLDIYKVVGDIGGLVRQNLVQIPQPILSLSGK
jgi:hypothetical protein